MQITPPLPLPVPNPVAVPAQAVRHVIPPAAPTITPRAVDSGEHGQKGQASGSATQKPGAQTRSPSNRPTARGRQLDVLV